MIMENEHLFHPFSFKQNYWNNDLDLTHIVYLDLTLTRLVGTFMLIWITIIIVLSWLDILHMLLTHSYPYTIISTLLFLCKLIWLILLGSKT